VLLILTRARTVAGPAAPPARRWLAVPQAAGMFALTMVGWLLFRETEIAAIGRDLTLSPFGVSELDRQTGAYLFLLAFIYSVPLWVQSVWVELHRGAAIDRLPAGEPRPLPPLPQLALQGLACGLALAAIMVFRSHASLDFIYFQF
jgi:hypothetical protein